MLAYPGGLTNPSMPLLLEIYASFAGDIRHVYRYKKGVRGLF